MDKDIWIITEVKKEGKWVCLDKPVKQDKSGRNSIIEHFFTLDRNYETIAYLDGLVGLQRLKAIHSLKGLPKDCSDLVNKEFKDWEYGAKYASYLSLAELLNWWRGLPKSQMEGLLLNQRVPNDDCLRDFNKIISVLERETDNPEDIRIIYWFD